YKNEKKGVIKKNIPVGTWRYWDENGKLFKERIFEHEKPVMEKLYTGGIQTGKKIYKYKGEALAKIEEYSDSLLIKEKIYNEAGKLFNVISYTNGNLTQELIYKYQYGKLKKIETYNEDILTKESIYNDGVLSEKKLYDNGKLTRELIYTYSGLFREKIYENDLLIKEKGAFD
ncbi:unnamed protein product, partial [marine sediment metagenome]